MRSFLTTALAATITFSGVASAGQILARHGLLSQEYQNLFNTQSTINGGSWKLNDVTGYLSNGVQKYACIWEQVPGHNPQLAYHGHTSDSYQQVFNQATGAGYTPMLVNGYTAPDGTDRYAAIFERLPTSTAWVARHRLTSDAYQAEFNKWVGQGYRLKWVSGYSINNVAYYAAIWDKPASVPEWNARHGMTSDVWQAEFNDKYNRGYTLRLVSGYNVAGTDYYACIWDKLVPQKTFAARHRVNSQQYQQWFDTYNSQGLTLKLVSGYNIGATDMYAAIWSK